jgi:hypothetical protein
VPLLGKMGVRSFGARVRSASDVSKTFRSFHLDVPVRTFHTTLHVDRTFDSSHPPHPHRYTNNRCVSPCCRSKYTDEFPALSLLFFFIENVVVLCVRLTLDLI